MKLDNGTLQRFRESGIHCISLLHADHAFTANGVQNFFFSGSSVTEGVRSLDIGSGCKPIKRLTPAFVHYFVKVGDCGANIFIEKFSFLSLDEPPRERAMPSPSHRTGWRCPV